MKFKKYQHIERIGTTTVDSLLFGECYVFYKIDGTNGSVYLGDDGEIKAGSRNRELSIENDNAGFYAHILQQDSIKQYLKKHPTHRLYMEWLVPHSLKTYEDDAWRQFYVFDVVIDTGGNTDDVEYLPYDTYKPLLEEFNINYIPPIAIIKNPTYESLIQLLDKTGQFLIKDGEGKGEGLVVKNYGYKNRYGRQIWGKIVTNEFKEKHHKTMGSPIINARKLVEENIVNKYVTESLVEKEFSKIVNETGGWESKLIPRLLHTVYYSLVSEECWNFVKEHKNPQINFKTLMSFCNLKVKEIKKELF